ncbi:MAG: hypothetical protein AAFW75_06075 [Cyanobacteria bacterium J06636_16]
MLLENLDTVPWSTLYHAYGKARDTPCHLKNLASEDKSIRTEAYDILSVTIVHQGSVYEAAVHAIPFLVELLQASEVSDKHNILDLLYDIAVGGSWHDHFRHITGLFGDNVSEHLQARTAAQKQWIIRTRSLLAPHMEIILSFLQAEDYDVFRSAVALLTNFRDVDESIYQDVIRLVASTQDYWRQADLILLLSYLGESRSRHQLIEFFEASSSELVRFSSAIGIGLNGAKVPNEIAEYLSATIIKNDGSLIRSYSALGASNQYWFDAAKVLSFADAVYVDRCVPTFIKTIEEASYCVELQLCAVLLVAFCRDGYVSVANPSASQQQAVYAVAQKAFPDPQRTQCNATRTLSFFGLPDLRETIDSYLGLPSDRDAGFYQPQQEAIARHRRWISW